MPVSTGYGRAPIRVKNPGLQFGTNLTLFPCTQNFVIIVRDAIEYIKSRRSGKSEDLLSNAILGQGSISSKRNFCFSYDSSTDPARERKRPVL